MAEIGVDQNIFRKRVSRRDFLKIAAGVVGGTALAAASGELGRTLRNYFLLSQKDAANAAPFTPDLVFKGERYVYEGATAEIIGKIKEDFGISMICPTTWGEKSEHNVPYPLSDITLIAKTLYQLPPKYVSSSRSPREIILLRSPGSNSEGAGGGYNGRAVFLNTSETFTSDRFMHGKEGDYYLTEGNHLKATVTHEFTHSFTEAEPELLDAWTRHVGWTQKADGSWANRDPKSLIHSGGADVSPNEDLAVSAALLFVNPMSLSPKRIDFFLTNSHYASWPTVISYKRLYR